MEDLLFAPAHQLAAAIRERRISAVELLDTYLTHIARHNPALNAIVTLNEAAAHQRAHEADEALAHSQLWGPLHGVPITLEDCHATAGIRSTWGGFPPLMDHIPSEDSSVTARLKAAGAIILGKTNGPTIWPDSPLGTTSNPWDITRIPGGSSAGPAVAVAAGLTALDIGLDTLGSIQSPAHYCGVFGMRPTEHRVPLSGAFFIDAIRKFRIMSVVGPLARSVADLQLVLPILAGPDGRDFHVPPVPWKDIPQPRLQTTRIAWASTLPSMPIADDIRIAIERLAQTLVSLGGVVEQHLPAVDFAAQAQLADKLFDRIASVLEPTTEALQANPLDDYFTALHQRDTAIATWEEFFTTWDVLICPVAAMTAPQHTDTVITINNVVVPNDQRPVLALPRAISPITGCPTVVMPLGRDQNGLPFGVQIMGRRWDDERLLAIAGQVSEMTSGYQRPPTL
jgi:amidase